MHQTLSLVEQPLLDLLRDEFGTVNGPNEGVGPLRGERIYFDFDWKAYFGKTERRFKGQKYAAEMMAVTRENHGQCDFLFLTHRTRETLTDTRQADGKTCVIASLPRIRSPKVSRLELLRAKFNEVDSETQRLLSRLPESTRHSALLSLLLTDLGNRTLPPDELAQLITGVAHIMRRDLNTAHLMEFLSHADEKVSMAMTHELMAEYPDAVRDFVEGEFVESDICALAYRRSQLSLFKRLLTDPDYFEEERAKVSDNKPETVWQRFFEVNSWIFGYGLSLSFLTPVGEKLEQTTTGSTLEQAGKRTDALMQTSGAIRSLCYVEIKHHKTQLCSPDPYRSGCFVPTRDLTGGICQIQATVETRTAAHGEVFMPRDRDGRGVAEIFHYSPRSFLVIGSLSEFIDETGSILNYRYRSFQLFREGVRSPEVITFDELYERARHIMGVAEDRSTRIDWPVSLYDPPPPPGDA